MRSTRIIIVLFALLIAAFLVLMGRCFYLQYFAGDHYFEVCTNQQQSRTAQKPQRGVILDCRGRVLAASNKIQTIFAESRIIDYPMQVSRKLGAVLGMPANKICRIITEGNNPGFAKIKVGANPSQCSAAEKIYGIGIQSDWQRYYPAGTLTCHAVGFTSADNRGLGGIELQYDKELVGSAGENIFFADAFRRPIQLRQQKSILEDGLGVISTLDATIQQFTRAELLKQYESYEAESAVAIVAQPKTGAILAMVSLPDFDPNNIHTTNPNNFCNRAINSQFEPGSIIKPIIAAIALDAGVVGRNEEIFCENGSYHGKGFGSIGEYANHAYGNLSVREILVKSSNIGMAKIGQKVGKDRLCEGLERFGFGRKTGIDLPGEAEGLLRPADKWTGYSVTRIPFGQEISTTATQLLTAFCILANGGHPVRLFVVRATVDSTGQVTKLKQPSPGVGFVVKPEVAKWIVEDALVGVVNEGTGRKAKLEKWQLFGKTGTANIAKSDGRGYSEDDYIASFIAGAPVEEPKVVVLVSIQRPNKHLGKGYTGGEVAAPVAARIIEKTLNYLERYESNGGFDTSTKLSAGKLTTGSP